MFSDAEKVDIRFFCGYQILGGANVPAFGARYFGSYGLLEFRMTNMSEPEEDFVRDMVTDLHILYADVFGTRDNLDTDRAAVWYRNKNEVPDRENLFKYRRVMLCDYIGIAFGGVGSRYSFRLVN